MLRFQFNLTLFAAFLISGSASGQTTHNVTIIPADFIGDGRNDPAVYFNETGMWQIYGCPLVYFGQPGDIPVAGDFDGLGYDQIAVYRPSAASFFIKEDNSTVGAVRQVAWGRDGDLPVVGDYNGDGVDDLGVWRPSDGRWYLAINSDRWDDRVSYQWGRAGDVPVANDWNGDGATEIGVWRPNGAMWYVATRNASWDQRGNNFFASQWGRSGDIPVAADYDGDGIAEIGIWRPEDGTWHVSLANRSWGSHGDAYLTEQWGEAGDTPAPGLFRQRWRDLIAVWDYDTFTFRVLRP